MSCLPEYRVGLAVLLGPQLSCVDSAKAKAREIMQNPIDPYVQPLSRTIHSDAPPIKALAVMEQHDTSYIFVVDDGEYRGVITIQAIAHLMTEL